MTIDKKLLIQVEELSSLFFTLHEIAVILGVPEDDCVTLINDQEVIKRAEKGRLLTEATVRKNVFDLAKSGSSNAQTLAVKIMDDFNVKNIDV
jgi:hypothetical protein